MHPLAHLAVIWAAVFVAVVAAKNTRLTPVLFFLFMGFSLGNIGVLPVESDLFIGEFAELGIILNVAVPLTINWWRPHHDAAEQNSY